MAFGPKAPNLVFRGIRERLSQAGHGQQFTHTIRVENASYLDVRRHRTIQVDQYALGLFACVAFGHTLDYIDSSVCSKAYELVSCALSGFRILAQLSFASFTTNETPASAQHIENTIIPLHTKERLTV